MLTVALFILVFGLYGAAIFGSGLGEADNWVDKMMSTALTFLLVTLVASLLLVWLLSFFRLGFGWESLIVRTCLEIGVTAHPPGFEIPRCEQRTFNPAELETELRGMAHSMPYASRKIVTYAGEWILRATGQPLGG